MARELSISYQGAGANLYVVIRNTTDGTVWSTVSSAFATWADGSIADYDIALTDEGGDLYTGDFPSAITTGDYRVTYYERAGGSPATSDLILKSVVKHWDGTALTASNAITLSAYALTTLASVKRRLEITDSDSDDTLTELVNQVSAEIETITGRKFKARDYRRWLNGRGQRQLRLPHFPVQGSPRISFGAAAAMTLTYSGSAIRASAGVYTDPELYDAGGLRLVTYDTSGVKTSTDLPLATYGSVSALATQVNTLSGWTATVMSNQPSLDLHPSGSENALNRTVTLSYPDLTDFTFSVNNSNGLVEFDNYSNNAWPWWGNWSGGMRMPPGSFQHILVEWRAGFETIPDDVALICNEIVADKYFEGQTGRGVAEIKLGPGTLKLDRDAIDDIREQLKHYIDASNLIGEG